MTRCTLRKRTSWLAVLALIMLFSFSSYAQNESDFYTEKNHLVDQTVNLVTDYGANGNDTQEDSPALQQAIDDMSALTNGGKIIIPLGTYYFREIFLRDNVHIEIEAGTTILAGPGGTRFAIFRLGAKTTSEGGITVRNVSVRGVGGRFTVDLSNPPFHESRVFELKNTDNFFIADMDVYDKVSNPSKFNHITMNLGEDVAGNFYAPKNGIVKNCTSYDAHGGYGMVQCQVGYNLLIKNVHVVHGGIAVRLESGAVDKAPNTIVDNVVVRDVSSTNGSLAVLISPHTKENGFIDVQGVTANSAELGVKIMKGFFNVEKGQTHAGHFLSTSIVADVHATYGTNAHLFKTQHDNYVPCEIRNLISGSFNPDGETKGGPSVAAIFDRAGTPGGAYEDGYYQINISNVTQEGFVYQDKTIITEEDEATNTQCGTATASYTYSTTGATVNFDGSGSSDSNGSIVHWFWNYGDGTTGTGQTSSHTYSTNGDYNVQLQVTDNTGATDSHFQTVSVTGAGGNVAPTSAFTFSATDLSVDFDGSTSSDPDGTIASYAWDFGDGASGSGITVNHLYAAAGSYNVSLTVTDNGGATDVSVQTVTVTAGGGSGGGLVLGGIYKITAVSSGKAMTVLGASSSNDTEVVQETYTGASHQQWQLQENGTGFYQLYPMHTPNRVLRTFKARTKPGENATIFFATTGNNKTWKIIDLGNGFYQLENKASELSLGVENNSQAEGANIVQNAYSGTSDMQWQFTLLSTGARTVDDELQTNIPSIMVYPNPVKDILNLSLGESEVSKVMIFDMAGKIVLDTVVDGSKSELNLNSLKQGMYRIHIAIPGQKAQSFGLIKE